MEAQVVVGVTDVGCTVIIGECLRPVQNIPFADMENGENKVAVSV
jgi:hypothetical protein